MDVETGMNMNDISNSHACRVKSVVPKAYLANLAFVQMTKLFGLGRPILGSGRNDLINDWIKTDITRSQYGEAIAGSLLDQTRNQPNNPHIPATWRILYTMHQKCDTRNRIIFIGTKW